MAANVHWKHGSLKVLTDVQQRGCLRRYPIISCPRWHVLVSDGVDLTSRDLKSHLSCHEHKDPYMKVY